MTSTHSGKSSRQATSGEHGEITDPLSWEGSSVKTRSKNSSLHSTKSNLQHYAKSKDSANTASSDHVRKSISQYNIVPPSASSGIPSPSRHSSSTKIGRASQNTSTSLSRIGTQLLECDSIWYEIKQEFPTLADYFEEMQLDKLVPQKINNLFRLKQLPFSPYSQMMCQLRPTMERYGMF